MLVYCEKRDTANRERVNVPCLPAVGKGGNMQKTKLILTERNMEEFRDYLYEREHAEATVRKYITDIRTFYRYLNGKKEVDKTTVLSYKEWLVRNYAVTSVNSMLAALNSFFKYLGAETLKVKRIRIQKSLFLQEQKELTGEEYRKLVDTARKEHKYQLAVCMETMATTGIRISELEYFTVEAVRAEYIEIFNKGKYRRIYIPETTRNRLLKFAGENGIDGGAIFVTRNGKPKNRSNIWREMKGLQKKAGIDGEKIFPHNLRHLFARTYYTTTKDLSGLGDLLGHSSLNVTRIYTSSTGKNYQKQLDRMKEFTI